MKKFVKLLPALVMLLISAILVSTTTYAWFSMNSQVTAQNMKVKAVAEQGIVIRNSDTTTAWSNLANSHFNVTTTGQNPDAPVLLLPTSTTENANPGWVHAMSPYEDDANASLNLDGHGAAGTPQDYESLNLVWSNTDEGIGYVDDATQGYQGTERQFVRRDVFYIRAASTDISGHLYINSLETTGANNELDKALRVLVVLTEQGNNNAKHAFLFKPVTGATATYYWNDETGALAANQVTPRAAGANINVDTGITAVPNLEASAIRVDVYTFFEGEDAALKSSNAPASLTMSTLDTTIVFGTSQTTNP